MATPPTLPCPYCATTFKLTVVQVLQKGEKKRGAGWYVQFFNTFSYAHADQWDKEHYWFPHERVVDCLVAVDQELTHDQYHDQLFPNGGV